METVCLIGAAIFVWLLALIVRGRVHDALLKKGMGDDYTLAAQCQADARRARSEEERGMYLDQVTELLHRHGDTVVKAKVTATLCYYGFLVVGFVIVVLA